MNFCERRKGSCQEPRTYKALGREPVRIWGYGEQETSESDSGHLGDMQEGWPEAGQGYVHTGVTGHSPGGTGVLQDGILHTAPPSPAGLPGERAGWGLATQASLWDPHPSKPGTASPAPPARSAHLGMGRCRLSQR